ncbi:putative signal transducing protein [Marivirga harenae]|uniref:putative signal transducing protein n=1 Tax=Marivirga harenae TaxID=2010992 RepID=UPI0026E09445|nr:DUF2007 domain-containing protein [Marivirga harenae]WKV10699.1 DUF2007 domain-containing protein [Marivirga harenae]
MKNQQSDIVRIHSDTEININLLQDELNKIGIPSMVKNDFQSATLAGFGSSSNAVDLYVNANDFDKASEVIQDLNKGS